MEEKHLPIVPTGKAGTNFVKELTKLYQAFADASSLERIALKACTVLQCLVLQKPHARSKTKEHATHLERRLSLWQNGDITTLLHEGKCIQRHLPPPTNQAENLEITARIFSNLMLQGRVNAALLVMSKDTKGGILSMDDLVQVGTDNCGHVIEKTTRILLEEKHSKGQEPQPQTLKSYNKSSGSEIVTSSTPEESNTPRIGKGCICMADSSTTPRSRLQHEQR